jgi:ribonuclease HII
LGSVRGAVPTVVSLADLKKRYVDGKRPLPTEVEAALRDDPRAGARAILAAVERRRHENRSEGQRLRNMLRFEQPLWSSGIERIAGVDEAGMSPLAGPVSAGAVVLPVGCRIPGVDDSKKLDASTREELAKEIRAKAIAYAVAFVEPEEIDRINIYWAGLLAMQRAVQALGVAPQHLLIDARKLRELPIAQQGIIKGDEKSLSIAAASILAKTARDALMEEMDRKYPGYGFKKHKGYPVKEHVAALAKLGVTPIHRRSFGPVRQALGLDGVQVEMFATGSTATMPEDAVEEHDLVD